MWTGKKQLQQAIDEWHDESRRALDAFREQLDGITSRLERVESAPTASDRVLNLEELGVAQDATLEELHTKIKDLTFAVSEGIERTDRAERRIRNAIQRARKELEARGYEDPGLEAEAHELRVVDGDGGKDGGLPAVSEKVAEVDGAPSSIKGVSAGLLRKRWGY